MSKRSKRIEALVYHARPQPGKIKIVPTKPYSTQRDLALAYSPGVAEPCLEIEKDISKVYKYTSKGNLVAVISNGTAVLGLGDIGPEASKPVMEGKGLLFKIFADIDGIDIELDTKDVDKFVETVKTIAPTFGGINLEDIKAPEAFEIERRLRKELDIPVMHDDQHGTAIISAAALLNAVEITGKKMSEIKLVINGAGAAAISCTKLYRAFGVQLKHIVMLDSKGVIRSDREGLLPEKAEFASDRKIDTLEDAMVDADVFIGLSIADVVTPEMLRSMAKNPIVFAMANPNPEIAYPLALEARKDIIMATGRSDYPNQVNNVLGFPFIFRGALDVRAKKINEEMKMAAVRALADLAKEPVPEQVNITYGETKLSFGKEYIIPKPFDPRLITKIPPAVAKAAMETKVAKEPISDWELYEDELLQRLGKDNKIIRLLHDRARANPKKIVFAEGDHLNILKAAQILYDEGMATPVLLGDKQTILELMEEIDFESKQIEIIDLKSDEYKEKKEIYAKTYWETRRRNGVTLFEAQRKIVQRNYFAAMMVSVGDADAMISGYSRSYPTVLKPILEVIGTAKGVSKAATMNLMLTDRGPIFFADTSININPTDKELVKITQMTTRIIQNFGFHPVVAMLSYSNFGSSPNEDARKMGRAVKYLHKYYPDIIVDGEVQSDFALNREMFKERFPFSKLVGKKVNTLIFPNLDAANITYKIVKEISNVESIGPIILGLNKAVHIVQLGASVDEIVNMSAIAVLNAQERAKKQQRDDYISKR